MADGEKNKVKTVSWLAQWKVDNLASRRNHRSDAFKIGIWNWCLIVQAGNLPNISIRLILEPNCITEESDNRPFAKIAFRAYCVGSEKATVSPQNGTVSSFFRAIEWLVRKPSILILSPTSFVSNGCSPRHSTYVDEKLIPIDENFVWNFHCDYVRCITVEVEFLDLKMSSTSNDAMSSLIWSKEDLLLHLPSEIALLSISRMFQESIFTDVTIETLDGSLKAHKAMLASSSPVFKSMFLHDFKEKKSSTIKMEDMSTDACSALLAYIYGTIERDNFVKHCLPLLAAADKYDLEVLKKCCEETLLKDINSDNVLEMLQKASLYKLDQLKKACLTYLFDFKKLHRVREKLNDFFHRADRELLLEVFEEIFTIWKPC